MLKDRLRCSAPRILLLAAVAVAFSACELSSGFLSESERSSLYTLEIASADGSAIKDGAVILPGTDIAAIVDKKAGASDLATLDFSLIGHDGKPAAGLSLRSPAAKILSVDASSPVPTASKSVHSIDGKLSGFVIPAGTASGLYTLSASIASSDGAVLQKDNLQVFIGRSRPVIESVSTFPPSVEPGSAVLLGLRVSWLSLVAPAVASPVAVSAAAVSPTAVSPTAAAPDAAPADATKAASTSPSSKELSSPAAPASGVTETTETTAATPEASPVTPAATPVSETVVPPVGETAVSTAASSSGSVSPSSATSEPVSAAFVPETSAPAVLPSVIPTGAETAAASPSTASATTSATASATASVAAVSSLPAEGAGSTSVSVATDPAQVATEPRDPWIRWSKNGVAFAEGALSGGLDKVVWQAPGTEGAYSILVELFPAAPLSGGSYSFTASESQALKVMVIAPPGGSGNDFADPQAFYSLLRFDGSFDDVGTRPRGVQPESFGSPALDTYSSGFGYRFGPSSGVRIPGLMPPVSAGKLAAFSVVLRLDSEKTDGLLARFASDDGAYSLSLGLKDSKPYIELLADGKTQRSLALEPLPRFPLTVEAILKPEGEELTIEWRADGETIDAPSLPLPLPPPEGGAQLGGAQSLGGVYDGFGLIVGSSSASYRLASRRKWKSSLLIAESFDDGALPPQSVAVGDVSITSGALELEPKSSLSLGPSFAIAPAVLVEADIVGDILSCSIVFSAASRARILSIDGKGTVYNASGKAAGAIAVANGRIAALLELKDGTIIVRSPDGSEPVAIQSATKRFALSLERKDGSGQASFKRVLARSTAASPSRK
jgi:hypothetical protein